MSENRYHVILNANSGTAHSLGVTKESLQALFESHGLNAEIDADSDKDFGERMKAAVDSDANIIVAAGGDGTITGLADVLIETDKALAILPLGTVNALAKDLKIPLDLEEAVASLTTGQPAQIDVGEVNGKAFLHKVVVGVIPGMAAAREHIRGSEDPTAKVGLVRYMFRRMQRAKRIAVIFEREDGTRSIERLQSLAVSSNAYDQGLGRFFSRSKLDQGFLTLYTLRHLRTWDFFRLVFGMLFGKWHSDPELNIETMKAITVNFRKPQMQVMFDGEVMLLDTPMVFTIRPLALTVIVPETVSTEIAA
ncbi:diacylglycerol kinase [Devosia sp. MC532]|uniref:diacylglycerol/lipid kinase family protein n=1 Tax=Devosia sp. MC532 TaxID=2799788 RepID=UPI0018F6DCDF|nr:diacylglycerol kinase family protein [Devosia sp. MC532]MBJ7576889.1 diacylglycerol kinase [Devosia sp. MC532]